MSLPPSLRRAAALFLGFGVGALAVSVVPGVWLFRDAVLPASMQQVAGRRYACPMFCTMSDAPGDCPVCGMEMEPLQDQGMRVPLDHRARYMAGVRTAVIERRDVEYRIRALGRIEQDERREGQVTAWVAGRLDRLFADFTGTSVTVGDKIAELYAPDLLAAQEELLSARRARDEVRRGQGARAAELEGHAEGLYQATRRRLELLGVPGTVLDAIEAGGAAREHLDVLAKVGGTVLVKHVNVGDYVKTGQPLLSVADLSQVWAMLEVFEEDAGAVFVGQRVEVRVPSLPGEAFQGLVSFVDPVLDARRRIVGVRVDLANPEGRLKPGAFVDAEILVSLTSAGHVNAPDSPAPPGAVLLAPRSAVLDGGDRKLVYVMSQEPGPLKDGVDRWPAVYEPREIQTGFRIGDDVVVLGGLQAGESVVTRGQFLIDSQLQLTGKPSLMAPEAAGAVVDPHAAHRK